VTAALLVSDQHVADRRVNECVIRREDCSARVAEHHVDARLFEALNQCLGSSELHDVYPFGPYKQKDLPVWEAGYLRGRVITG